MNTTGPDAPSGFHCVSCGARLAHDQRYCLECGTRRGALPAPAAEMLGAVLEQGRGDTQTLPPAPPPQPGFTIPAPRAAASAILAMLGFGVLLGSLASANPANLARTVLVAVAPTPVAPPTSVADSGGNAAGGSTSAQTVTTITQTVGGSTSSSTTTAATTSTSTSAAASTPSSSTTGLPQIKHVFLIVLSNQGLNETFGLASKDTYLSHTLLSQGELVQNYYAVAGSQLANGIALISGQGPTVQTDANCPQFTPITPGSTGAGEQVIGNGCIYPKTTTTLPEQLTDNGNTWRAYVQGIGNAPPGQPTTCRHPTIGAADPYQVPRPGDPYLTWRNPFVYFEGIIGSPDCSSNIVDLEQLATDLNKESTTPAFSYIVPSACDDGDPEPCVAGAQGGLPAADAFLQSTLAQIEQSAAYRDNGLIAITFDGAPQSGPNADSSGCCNNPTFPNLPTAAATSFLTRWGHAFAQASDISGASLGGTTTTSSSSTSSSTTSSTSSTPTSTTSSTTTTDSSTISTSTSSSTSTGSTTPTSTTPTTTPTTTPSQTIATTLPSSSASASSTTTTSSSTSAAGATATSGGGEVGMVLISQFVKPGSKDLIDNYNHFSFLATVEKLFGLDAAGYAKNATPFDPSVFNGG